jgi:hypothetical protein
MLEQSTLMCNITLFENELKMVKLCSNIHNRGHGGGCAYEGITKRIT